MARFPSKLAVKVILAAGAVILGIVVLLIAPPTQLKQLISTLMLHGGYISVEMLGAPAGRTPQDRVEAWLHRNGRQINSISSTYRVDPLAIAGAIAYESLANAEPSYYLGLAEYAGPGKVHFRENRFSEGDPVAKEVEDEGYLPREHESDREYILATSEGAVTYIAAILDAFSNVADRAGYAVRCSPATLVTLYSAWNLREIKQHFAVSGRHALQLNDAGQWFRDNSRWIARASGSARCRYSRLGFFKPNRTPTLPRPTIHIQR